MKVAVLFDHFGPYHLARLRAAGREVELLAVEFGGRSRDYAWNSSQASESFSCVTLVPGGSSRECSHQQFRQRLNSQLADFAPQTVAIPGWSGRGAFAAMQWCQRAGVPVIAMSESTAHDEARSAGKEWIKCHYLNGCSAALVGGRLHSEYLQSLGLNPRCIFVGYDAVDNDYFRAATEKVVSEGNAAKATPYFLASARFIEKKNLPFLLRAYARYRSLAEKMEPWNLIMLGDGPLRDKLNDTVAELGLGRFVSMPGFVQYEQLPDYYAGAGAFVHVSRTEQWGLVVNEAMASGLPVLVSDRCGCAPDLVQEGVNGWTFDPTNAEHLAELMLRVSTMPNGQREEMGGASCRAISHWGPDRFAQGLRLAAECAVKVGPRRMGIVDRLLLRALAMR